MNYPSNSKSIAGSSRSLVHGVRAGSAETVAEVKKVKTKKQVKRKLDHGGGSFV